MTKLKDDITAANNDNSPDFSKLFDALPDAIIILSNEGRVVYGNKAWKELFPKEHDIPVEYFSTLPRDYRNSFIEFIQNVIKGKRGFFEYEKIHVTNEKIVLEANGAPFQISPDSPVNALLVLRNITEVKNEEIKLAYKDKLYKLLFDLSPNGIIIEDSTGKVLDANEAAYKSFGYERDEFIGMDVKNLLLPETYPLVNMHIEEIMEGKKVVSEVINLRKDGSKCWRQLYEAMIILPDNSKGILVINDDITDRKLIDLAREEAHSELEKRVIERTVQLHAAVKDLEVANRELESFSFSVSHDLKSPLRHIIGYCGILADELKDSIDPEYGRMLERIRHESVHMGELIESLLKLARFAKEAVSKERINLSAIAEKIAGGLLQNEPDRKCIFDIKPDLYAFADAKLMEIVLSNLLNNSWKFTGEKEIAEIEVSSYTDSGKTIYFVKDNGAGFPQEQSSKMFIPFNRLHDDEKFEGTGIGLATIQRIILRHGGKVWAKGEVNKGAVLYFTLE